MPRLRDAPLLDAHRRVDARIGRTGPNGSLDLAHRLHVPGDVLAIRQHSNIAAVIDGRGLDFKPHLLGQCRDPSLVIDRNAAVSATAATARYMTPVSK